ncbi:MAG: NAD(P)-dependent oxidoreductase [Kiritimatiellia bacterium]
MKNLLIFLPNAVESFQPTASQLEFLRQQLPQDWRLQAVATEAEFLQCLPSARAAVVWTFRQDWFTHVAPVFDLFTPAAGRDYFHITPPSGTTLHYGHFHGAIIAETALASILGFSRGILPFHPLMHGDPRPDPWPRKAYAQSVRRLALQTILILGFGAIGKTLAQMLLPFRCRIIGITRTPHPAPSFLRPTDMVATVDELDSLLPEADHVVGIVPSDTGSTHLLDAARLSLLKPTAILHNYGRGNLIDENALIPLLRTGKIAGAVLDVFEQEPLPATSPLRFSPNTFLLPHASAFSPDYLNLYFSELAEELSPLS